MGDCPICLNPITAVHLTLVQGLIFKRFFKYSYNVNSGIIISACSYVNGKGLCAYRADMRL